MAQDHGGTDYVVRTGLVLDLLDQAEAANSGRSAQLPRAHRHREQWVVDGTGEEVTCSPSLGALRQLLPARYHSLVQVHASSPAEVWLNAHLYAVAVKLTATAPAVGREAQMLTWLEDMTAAERLHFAQRHIGGSTGMDAPTYRLMARDQGSGREYVMRYGFVVDLLREARVENARNKDYWVVDLAGIELDSIGQPVEIALAAVAAPSSALAAQNDQQLASAAVELMRRRRVTQLV
jgi:hypothetical protein